MIRVNGKNLRCTEDGFLADPADWDETVAEAFATGLGITLGAEHYEIIHLLRGYHARYRHVPNNRMLVKAVQKVLGEAKGNSRYLHRLFPESPVKCACLLAGLPKPPGCL